MRFWKLGHYLTHKHLSFRFALAFGRLKGRGRRRPWSGSWADLSPRSFLPATGRHSAIVGCREEGGILAPKPKQHWLTVQFARCTDLSVGAALLRQGPVQKPHVLQCSHGSAHLPFCQPQVRPVGQCPPVNRKDGEETARRRPEPGQEAGQGERGFPVARR